MRELSVNSIRDTVENLYIRANYQLSSDMECAIQAACDAETNPLAKSIFTKMQENLQIAEKNQIPICQDTGMAVVFAEVGQDVHICDGAFEDAINDGIANACKNGYLRASVVKDPLLRENTTTNAPAVLHTRIVPGTTVRLIVMPKGFGSENMSTLKLFRPSIKAEEIVAYVIEAVKIAGSNPCPPIVVGVGLGGTADMATLLAKKALLRQIGSASTEPLYARMEQEILNGVNALGIGPQGLGGKITALSVAIERYPTHIAGLPCAVNIGCHVTRHAEAVL